MSTSVFLRAEWRKLIMAQYVVSAAVLQSYLPSGVELDLFEGKCYVSLVGFLFDRVRIKGIAVPWHTKFEEVNLRFYVKRTERDGSVKRGVVFIREIVPRMAITVIANALYEEPYATASMRRLIRSDEGLLKVRYDWKHRGAWQTVGVEASATASPILAGSEEAFITEHYWGYTKRRRGAASQYQVEHPSWDAYPILRHDIQVDFGSLYGAAFAPLSGQEPASVLLAEGSAVSVYGGTRLD